MDASLSAKSRSSRFPWTMMFSKQPGRSSVPSCSISQAVERLSQLPLLWSMRIPPSARRSWPVSTSSMVAEWRPTIRALEPSTSSSTNFPSVLTSILGGGG
ncbi:hypothetical protein CRUP_036133 [Coryphaenoides rupestris]|nr:hypothetical protein CRUP_036133 [Coryphaenoides rupestris]